MNKKFSISTSQPTWLRKNEKGEKEKPLKRDSMATRIISTSISAPQPTLTDLSLKECQRKDPLFEFRSRRQAMVFRCRMRRTQHISSVFITNQCRLIQKRGLRPRCKPVLSFIRVKLTKQVSRITNLWIFKPLRSSTRATTCRPIFTQRATIDVRWPARPIQRWPNQEHQSKRARSFRPRSPEPLAICTKRTGYTQWFSRKP